MDTWKGKKLHGADRRLTRAQLEEWFRKPTMAESLDATIACMTERHRRMGALHVALGQLERGDAAYSHAKTLLLRNRLAKAGRIVKPKTLMQTERIGEWLTAFLEATNRPGRRAQIALLTVMELPRQQAVTLAAILRLTLYAAGMIRSPYLETVAEVA